METRPIFILMALLVAAGAFADAYKWTDEEGLVHYSDRPHPGATIIDLDQSAPARPRPTSRLGTADSGNDAAEEPSVNGYFSIAIESPAAEETLWNIEETLSVSITLAPELRPGHQVRVYLDKEPQMVGGTSFQLSEVYRGVHNLQVEVIDETGRLLIRSRPSRFYVQQNSIL